MTFEEFTGVVRDWTIRITPAQVRLAASSILTIVDDLPLETTLDRALAMAARGDAALLLAAESEAIMPERLIDQVRACHEFAGDAKQKAEAAPDPELKTSLLDMEKRWLALARSYALIESLVDPSATTSDQSSKLAEGDRVDAAPDESLRLQEISNLLIQEGDVKALYERVLDTAIGLMSADMGSMQTFYTERGELRLLAWRGFHPKSAAFWERVHLNSACACGVALSVGRRIMVPDTEACDFFGAGDLDAFRRSNIRAVQSTPLVSRSGQLLGMISTHWREPHRPAERALRALDVLARQAADFIERNEAEAALRESEERFRWLASLVDSSDDAIISKKLNGIITSWNKGAERLFGYTTEEAIGQPVTILIPPDRQNEERIILERIGRGERIEHFETVRKRKDGSSIVISLTVSPIKNVEGRIVGASKIARDITERTYAEAREKVLMAELTQMNRMATAGELSASIAHEVIQPLTGIVLGASAALRWLAADKPDLARVRALVSEIVNAGHRASDVISSVRAMFKKDTKERIQVNVNNLIVTILSIVRFDLEKNGVELRMQLDEWLPFVECDPIQMQQVVLNLIMNAIQSMHSVQLRVLTITSERSRPDIVHVSIEDTGTGVDPSNFDRIFKPLFTTKEHGMGVGLSICRSIIESHQGRIWAAAGASGGSIFQFELPTKTGES